MSVQMQWRLNGETVEVFATEAGQVISLLNLTSSQRIHLAAGLARVEAAVVKGEDGVTTLEDGSGYRFSRAFLQALSTGQARSLGLPGDVPFSLWVRLNGAFVSPNTSVTLAWHHTSGSQICVREDTGILSYGSKSYRVPMTLARIQRASERFNAIQGNLDSRLAVVLELKAALELAAGESLGTDRQLSDMRFRHASAVSLDVAVAKDGVSFDPVFFSEEVRDQAQEEGLLVKATESLLTPELQRKLAQQFRSASVAKPTYVLSQGEYLYVDPSLRIALDVIKDYQGRPAAERARFAKAPQSFLKDRLFAEGFLEEECDQAVNRAFVETDAFSERVIEVGLWQPRVLPFVKRTPNNWFPEAFGLKIGTKTVTIPESQLEPLAKALAKAILTGSPDVIVPGTSDLVPASRDALDAVNAMLELFLKVPCVEIAEALEPDDLPPASDEGQSQKTKSILVVQDNFEEESFIAQFSPRVSVTAFEEPEGVVTQLKQHQVQGVEWLQRCWALGYPGVLLADDMGLGKTLQTLGFIAWLQRKRDDLSLPKKPILVIAPISLLGSWQSEAQRHLSPGSLGEMACLYGSYLSQFKQLRHQRADVIEGVSTLDVTRLRSFDWVLTTYETMRDYHLSLGLIDFAFIAFDEMQKIKNPQSMMTNAAQALQGEFKVGLTGTPIENSLADIWTLFDTLMPGALGLGNLRQFLMHYRLDAPDALKELKGRLTESTESKPASMLRRMKIDVARDLPLKIEKTVLRAMPEKQALAYMSALNGVASAGGQRGRRDAFHRIRGISLHPNFADKVSTIGGDDYVAASARLTSCLNVLDEVRAKGEKALVFVESLAMQEWLAFYLRERYQLQLYPARIYGDTTADRRTAIVDQFQSVPEGEFDVLLLSPKAAGIGLTLTAASHVIHLTRWWNPAVEDQCTDRAYRIGQTKDVTVYYLQAVHPLYGDSSFDCVLDQLLSRKRALSRSMLVPLETGDELDEIFKALAGMPE